MSSTTTNIPTRSFIEPTQACARSSSKHRPFDEPSRRGKHLAVLPDKERGIVGFDHQAKHAKALIVVGRLDASKWCFSLPTSQAIASRQAYLDFPTYISCDRAFLSPSIVSYSPLRNPAGSPRYMRLFIAPSRNAIARKASIAQARIEAIFRPTRADRTR